MGGIKYILQLGVGFEHALVKECRAFDPMLFEGGNRRLHDLLLFCGEPFAR